ncbi:hypothetical protein [Mycobacterium leprae]|nr:hypothetical protein [Mycobacterium leprae]
MRVDDLIAVHFMVDVTYAEKLRKRWDHYEFDIQLRVVECPGR